MRMDAVRAGSPSRRAVLPVIALAVAGAALTLVQLVLPWPLVAGMGLLLMISIIVLADPRPVGVLALWYLALSAALALAFPDQVLPDYWVRYPWLVVLALLAVGLAEVERRRARRLTETGRLLSEFLEATDQPIFAKRYDEPSSEGRYEIANRAWARAAAVADSAPSGWYDRDVYPPDVAARLVAGDREALEADRPVTSEEPVHHGAEEQVFLVTKFPLRDGHGKPWGVGGIATDVTAMRRAESRLEAVFAQSPTATVRISLAAGDPVVLDANGAMVDLLGIDPTGRRLIDLADFVDPDDLSRALGQLTEMAAADAGDASATYGDVEIRLHRAGGGTRSTVVRASLIRSSVTGEPLEVIAQFSDVTERKELEAALTDKALTDPVTGLPNRYALADRLQTAQHRLTRRQGFVAVLFCDLDRFKDVNDVYGHDVGDELLAEVAVRLSAGLRPQDTVGRHGGDEFVVVCEDLASPAEAMLLAVRLQDRLRSSWSHGGHEFVPTMSVGIAVTDDASVSPGDLLRRADVAMYRAKESGRDRVEMYDHSFDEELGRTLKIQQLLRQGLEERALVLHYQPIVLIGTGELRALEGLVRLRAGDGSLLSPDRFLPQAETSGLMWAVGDQVMEQAFAAVASWRGQGRTPAVSVNISPSQLGRDGFADHLLELAAEAGADPAWIVAEVTETVLTAENDRMLASLASLSRAGVRIALDDFGTGYSSLAWLHEMPVDIVKIDKSFVQTMAHDHRRAVVVAAVLDIADQIGLMVVAEGVETEAQRRMLEEMGCTHGQGWLFGRPAPLHAVEWPAPALRG
jgi:diguanylate cyclase (GGDEF)-like protein